MTTMTPPTRRATRNAAHDDNWRQYAVCRETDPELFWPIGSTGPALVQIEQAKAVCKGCPVRAQCLEWALETEQDTGVWGGLSEQEREQIHGRRLRRTGEDGRSSVQVILEDRLHELRQLEAQGLSAWQIARRMRTNAQTIHNVKNVLAQQQGVSA